MACMFEKPGHILRLKWNLYGIYQAPVNFYKRLTEGLTHRGYRSARNDPCLWTNGQLLCLIYFDDCLLYLRNESDIDEALELITKPCNADPDGFNLKI